MSKRAKNVGPVRESVASNETGIEKGDKGTPRCLAIAQSGIRTSGQFAEMMACLMTDVVEGKVTPGVANAACNAGGKLLKVVEMSMKYGTQGSDGRSHTLELVSVEAGEKAA